MGFDRGWFKAKGLDTSYVAELEVTSPVWEIAVVHKWLGAWV